MRKQKEYIVKAHYITEYGDDFQSTWRSYGPVPTIAEARLVRRAIHREVEAMDRFAGQSIEWRMHPAIFLNDVEVY